MAVEISYYDVRLVSLPQCRESEWFRWWFVNLCLTTGDFPTSCKSSIVIPLIKKPGLDREM